MQVEAARPGSTDDAMEKTCTTCGHIGICTMMRAVAPLLGDFEDEHRPFEPTDMARICTKYISLAAMEVLKSAEGAL